MTGRRHSKTYLKDLWAKYKRSGYNQMKLAKEVGLPKGTLASQIQRARAELQVSEPEGWVSPNQARPMLRLSREEALRTWREYEANGFNQSATARAMGIARSTLEKRVEIAKIEYGFEEPAGVRKSVKQDELVKLLKRPGGATLDEVASFMQISRGVALDQVEALAKESYNIHRTGDHWTIHAVPLTGVSQGRQVTHESDENGMYRFGLVADSHIGSKYARIDVLNEIYDAFAREGIKTVYHCGNMIDGYKPGVNDHDVVKIGMDDQIDLLVTEYPRRDGIKTHAVSGDDHEGWYAQKTGIDIGKHIQNKMRAAGRDDWVDLGYMECFISLKHAVTGTEARLLVSHPGGGSSYADSYVVQKIIESFEGGEKPGIAAFGHYHKCLSGEYRNVWFTLVPCTQDQTPWARKKRLRYVIGGMIVEAWQNPETGAIERFRDEKLRYFNRGYYNDRWSYNGDVILPERTR